MLTSRGGVLAGVVITLGLAACQPSVAEAERTTVADANSVASNEIRQVRLTDLKLDCERQVSIRGRIYTFGHGSDRASILVRLPRGQHCCNLLESTAVGEVTRAPAWLALEAFNDPYGGESYLLFKPEPIHRSRFPWEAPAASTPVKSVQNLHWNVGEDDRTSEARGV